MALLVLYTAQDMVNVNGENDLVEMLLLGVYCVLFPYWSGWC